MVVNRAKRLRKKNWRPGEKYWRTGEKNPMVVNRAKRPRKNRDRSNRIEPTIKCRMAE